MLTLVTIFGRQIPTDDFWAGIVLLGTVGGIVLAACFARNGIATLRRVENIIFGLLAFCVVALIAYWIRGLGT